MIHHVKKIVLIYIYIAKNPRVGVTGMISKQVGARSNDKSALKYPRVSTFNRPAPASII